MKKFSKPIRILTIVFLSFLCLFIAATPVAVLYQNNINKILNSKTYITVQDDDDTSSAIYFESDYTDEYDEDGNGIYSDAAISQLTKDAEELIIEVEGEGLVLMKNDNDALPLSSGASVSLFGQGSVVFNYATTGSSSTSTAGYANFKEAMESVNFSVNDDLWDFYTQSTGSGYLRSSSRVNEVPWSSVREAAYSSFSEYGDAAIVVISRNSGEGSDIPATGSDGHDGSYLSLTEEELDMLEGLTALKGGVFEKIIVILNTSNPVNSTS